MTGYYYLALVERFLDGTITAEEFEKAFLNSFKAEPASLDNELYKILDKLFGAVDSYWHECEPGSETAFEISEDALREASSSALVQLKQYFAS